MSLSSAVPDYRHVAGPFVRLWNVEIVAPTDMHDRVSMPAFLLRALRVRTTGHLRLPACRSLEDEPLRPGRPYYPYVFRTACFPHVPRIGELE